MDSRPAYPPPSLIPPARAPVALKLAHGTRDITVSKSSDPEESPPLFAVNVASCVPSNATARHSSDTMITPFPPYPKHRLIDWDKVFLASRQPTSAVPYVLHFPRHPPNSPRAAALLSAAVARPVVCPCAVPSPLWAAFRARASSPQLPSRRRWCG